MDKIEPTNNVNLVDTLMSSEIAEIATALSAAQAELEAAKKDQSGYGYNYSDLNSVITTAKPILAKNGLCLTQLLGQTTTDVTVTTILAHKSGQYFKSVSSLPVIDMKGCNVAQGAGASISYLRRYAYQAILGMSSEDNDASSDGKKVSTGGASQKKSAFKADSKNSFRKSKIEKKDGENDEI